MSNVPLQKLNLEGNLIKNKNELYNLKYLIFLKSLQFYDKNSIVNNPVCLNEKIYYSEILLLKNVT